MKEAPAGEQMENKNTAGADQDDASLPLTYSGNVILSYSDNQEMTSLTERDGRRDTGTDR